MTTAEHLELLKDPQVLIGAFVLYVICTALVTWGLRVEQHLSNRQLAVFCVTMFVGFLLAVVGILFFNIDFLNF